MSLFQTKLFKVSFGAQWLLSLGVQKLPEDYHFNWSGNALLCTWHQGTNSLQILWPSWG